MAGPPDWMEGIPSSVYHFGDFRLDPARRELVKGNEMIELPSSSFDCLVYLIQHRERAVGRDELISAVWGRADISDNLLSQTLVRVRRALGEAASDRSSIRTVTKFGYRWIAPTRADPIASEAVRAANDPDAPLTASSVHLLVVETPQASANDSPPYMAPLVADAPGERPPQPAPLVADPRRERPPQPARPLADAPGEVPPLPIAVIAVRRTAADDTAAQADTARQLPPTTAVVPFDRDTAATAAAASPARAPDAPDSGTRNIVNGTPAIASDLPNTRRSEAEPSDASPLHTPDTPPPYRPPDDWAAKHDPSPSTSAPNAADARAKSQRTGRVRSRRAAITAAAAVGALLAVLATIALRQPHAPPHAAAASTPSIGSVRVPALVLPVDVRADAAWEWLRFGLMDLIANRLRQGGVLTLDSQSMYPLLGSNPDMERARPDAELGLSALSSQRIYTSAWLQAQQWHVRITSVGDSRRVDASGTASDVTAAARLAADNLLISLGRTQPVLDDVPASVRELLERSDVALLTNRPDEARELIAHAPPTLRDDVRVQVRAAEVDIRTGQLIAARERLQPLLPQLAAQGVELVRARALNDLALIAAVGDSPREATPLLDESSRLAEQFDSPADLARALQLRALQESALGGAEDALAHLAKARVLFDAAGDPLRAAGAELDAGSTSANIGRYNEALQHLTRAEASFQAFAARDQLAFARAMQVMVRLSLLDTASALALSDSYWPPAEAINNDRTRNFLAVSRAFALLRNGRLSEADVLFARVLATADAPQHTMARRNATLGSAEVALQSGAIARALEIALPLAHTPTTDENGATTRYLVWHLALEALRRRGDMQTAHDETTRFSAWADALDGVPSVSKAVLRDTRFYAALDRAIDEAGGGASDAALPHFAALLATAREQQMPQRIVDVATAYVPALLSAGRIDEASSVAGSVALWADANPDAAWAQAQVYRALGHPAAFHEAVERLRSLARERSLPALDASR